MKHFHIGLKGNGKIEQVAKFMLDKLFGSNIILTTQFEFLSIDDKISVEPEYYYTDRFKFFDFWYNPQHDWVPQLALAISDYYHKLSGIPGDKRTTANALVNAFNKQKHAPSKTKVERVHENA